MSKITTDQIKDLREKTGISSIVQCKKALEEAGGDMAKAMESLKAQGAEISAKKSGRTLAAGAVASYIHSTGNMGALVEVQSETDFVSKNPEFVVLANNLAMHIAAAEPMDVADLLTQPFIKDAGMTIGDLVKNYTQKFGERIQIIRFVRFDTSVKS